MSKRTGPDKLYRDVVDAAAEFHRRRLWRRVESDEPISIRLEGHDEELVAAVRGSGGLSLGLSVFRGPDAVASFESLFAGGADPIARSDELVLIFEPHRDVDPRYLVHIAKSKRVFGKNAAVPVIATIPGDDRERPMTRPEARVLLGVMRALALADTTDALRPIPWDSRRRLLEIEVEGRGKRARVVDRVITAPANDDNTSVDPQDAAFDPEWYEIIDGLPRRDATWGVAFLPAAPDLDEVEPEVLLLAVEAETGRVLQPQRMLEGDPWSLCDALLDVFTDTGSEDSEDFPFECVPREIRFLDPAPAEQARAALEEVGVLVTVDPDQPELLEVANGIADLVRHGALPRDLSEIDPEAATRDDWADALHSIVARMMDSDRAHDAAFEVTPLREYFGSEDDASALLGGNLQKVVVPAYLDWFLHTYRPRPGARTRADDLARRPDLAPVERALLDAKAAGRIVPVRVVAVDAGASLVVENVLTGERTTVHDVALSRTIDTGTGLFLRLFEVGEWTHCDLVGPPSAPFRVLSALEIAESCGVQFVDGSVSGDPTPLGRVWAALAHQPAPELTNLDGDPVEDLVATFRVTAPAQVEAALNAHVDLVDDGDARWSWVQAQEGAVGSRQRIVKAYVEWIGDELVVEANSERRLEAAVGLLAGLPGIELAGAGPAAPKEPRIDRWDPEERAALEEEMRTRIMGWLDESVPALGGRSPRDAYAIPSQRPAVERLIRTCPDPIVPWGTIEAPREEMLAELRGDSAPN